VRFLKPVFSNWIFNVKINAETQWTWTRRWKRSEQGAGKVTRKYNKIDF